MNRQKTADVLAALALTFSAAFHGAASAHDYWLEPTVSEDGSTSLHLFVGACLKADEEKHYESARTTRLEAWTAAGPTDLRPHATDDAQPLLTLPATASEQLIVFERNVSYIELDAKQFDDYLREEALEGVRAERRKTGETAKPGRERYRRFLKTLTPGASDDALAGETVKQTLELIPMEDPSALKPGERLHVRALLEGASLPGAKIELCMRSSNGKVKTLSAVSDRLGDVYFSIPSTGQTLVRMVHMRRVTDGDPKADWESLWASYSFVVHAK